VENNSAVVIRFFSSLLGPKWSLRDRRPPMIRGAAGWRRL